MALPLMRTVLKVLIVEDSAFDGQMLVNLLRQGGYEPAFERVETAESMKAALIARHWDVILADYNLPEFNALAALQILKDSQLDLPFIIVSGGIGEDIAVAAMKSGAHDYLMKGNLQRLVPAVERELREAAHRAGQRSAEQALLESELRYRLLWESAPDAVLLMDRKGHIHFANPAVKKIFGYEPEELVGQSLMVLQPERLREAHSRGIDKYIQTGNRKTKWKAMETYGLRKDGMEIPLEISFSDMHLNGQMHFVGFIRDITERWQLRANQEQLEIAREIQQRLFPKNSPQVPGFDIAGASYPAEATSGDYFDYLPMLQDRWGIIVADVTGHGVGPALLMAETRAYLRVLATRREDTGEILTRANRVLAEDVGMERFVTLFLARLDPANRSLVYTSAGHPPAYVINAQNEVKAVLRRSGVPLGINPDTQYVGSSELQLNPGDILILLTDGIEECLDPKETLFGIDRILDVVRANRDKSAHDIVEALYQAVRQFGEGHPQIDDVTAIIVKVLSPKKG
jgi:PAS domain S-box-containing protein